MVSDELLAILSIFFVASFLKGLTGLGFSTLCLGFLAFFMDLTSAIPLIFIPSISSNLMVMISAGRFWEGMKRFWLLYLSALPGLALGILFLRGSQSEMPKALLGLVMLLYGLWGLKSGIVKISEKREKQLTLPVGITSGVINGATGSQIMPIMPYLLSLKMERELFVQVINCGFTINSLVMIAGLGQLGFVSSKVLFLSAGGIVPVALGIFLGGKVRKQVTENIYRKMVLILLIALGGNLAVKPLL